MRPRKPKPRRPRVPAHAFEPDPAAGTTHDGRQVCAACAKPGRAGDIQHPADAPALLRFPPVSDEARRVDARMLGEAHR